MMEHHHHQQQQELLLKKREELNAKIEALLQNQMRTKSVRKSECATMYHKRKQLNFDDNYNNIINTNNNKRSRPVVEAENAVEEGCSSSSSHYFLPIPEEEDFFVSGEARNNNEEFEALMKSFHNKAKVVTNCNIYSKVEEEDQQELSNYECCMMTEFESVFELLQDKDDDDDDDDGGGDDDGEPLVIAAANEEGLSDDDAADNYDVPGVVNATGSGGTPRIPNYVCPEFNLWRELILPSVTMLLSPRKLPADADLPLFEGSTMTVKQFAEELRNIIMNASGIVSGKEKLEQSLMKFIGNLFGENYDTRFPVSTTYHNTKEYLHSVVDKYLPYSSTIGVYMFHVCTKGCTVYVGQNANLFQCPKCHEPRFHPCNKCKARFGCAHIMKNRRPYDVLRYKSITTTLIKLLKLPGFLKVKHYQNEDSLPGQLRDNPDCPVYIEAEKFMRDKFVAKYPDPTVRETIRFVSFCISVNYDGVQLYDSKASTFKPLFYSLQDLPSSFRNKVGVGMFLASAFTGVKSSRSEQFLFTDCFIRELNVLKEGIEVKLEGQKYFICAYLFKHVLDTAELESYTKTAVSQSNMGCMFCLQLNGLNRSMLDKNTYTGHRMFLPINHYFRAFGQSGQCCDKNYYKRSDAFKPVMEVNYTKPPRQKKKGGGKTGNNTKKSQKSNKASYEGEVTGGSNSSSEEEEEYTEEEVEEEEEDEEEVETVLVLQPKNKKPKVSPSMIQPYGTTTASKKLLELFCEVKPVFSSDLPYNTKEEKLFLAFVYNNHYRKDNHPLIEDDQEFDKNFKKYIASHDDMIWVEWVAFADNEEFKKRFHNSFHEDMKFDEIRHYLYFHHMDFRKQFDYMRVTHELYLEYAKRGEKNFKGVWYFHLLKYARIDRHICYDPMHAGKNLGHKLIDSFKGNRLDVKVGHYCRSIRTHPYLYQTEADLKTIEKYRKQHEQMFGVVLRELRNQTEHIDPALKLKNLAKYAVSNSDMDRADAWINAIIIPVGYSKEWQVKFVFRRSGFLRTDALIKWMVNILDFTLSAFRGYDKVYKSFFSMFSYDLSEMFSPVVLGADWVTKLYFLYCETAAAHEALFPEYEMTLNWHHFVCAIQHMKVAGPFQLWWAFAGERGNSVVKHFVPEAGVNPDKVFNDRYNKFEDKQAFNAYNFLPEKLEDVLLTHPIFSSSKEHSCKVDAKGDLCLLYSNERILLRNPQALAADDKFTTEEYEDLLETLYVNIKKRCNSFADCLKSSSFFRVYWYYLICKDYQLFHTTNTTPFVSFVKRLIVAVSKQLQDDTKVFERLKPFKLNWGLDWGQDNNWGNVGEQLSDEEFVNLLEQELCLVEVDFLVMDDVIDGFKYRMFKDATIFGMDFRSRGSNFRELSKLTEFVDKRYGAERSADKLNDPVRCWPDNKKNELKQNWINKDDYSSWAKVRYKSRDHMNSNEKTFCGTSDYEDDKNYLYGQFNFFVQIYSTDPFINNLTLASITCRRHRTIEKVDYVVADNDGDSYFVHKMFVALNDVYSSPIMTCAFKSSLTRKEENKRYRIEANKPQQNDEIRDEIAEREGREGRRSARTKKQVELFNGGGSSNNAITTSANSSNENFSRRIAKVIEDMLRSNTLPYCISGNKEEVDVFDYANLWEHKKVSYIVMLEMYRNRKYIRYNKMKDNFYQSTEFAPNTEYHKIYNCTK
jgi:hypothetical protein